MGGGLVRPAGAIASRTRLTQAAAPAVAGPPATWDRRLYAGLRVACVPEEVRATLASALGDIGVDAEHFLTLVDRFVRAVPVVGLGEAFLRHLESACQRLRRVALALEIATQSYVSALADGYPATRLADGGDDVWWPPFPGYWQGGEFLELRLRRCGFAYRHVVATHLASNVEAIAEHMALFLHALATLPPAGILPASTLSTGLLELTSTLQGYVIPHHVTDLNDATPGLLTGIARLRALTARDDTSLDSDIAWARAQYAFVRQQHASSAGQGVRRWAQVAAGEWQQTIASLESLRH
jgi:hypothetical protein